MNIIFHNLGWKFLSLVVAFGIWFVVMSSNSIEVTKEIVLDLDLPEGLVLSNEIPERVNFRLSGSKFFLRTLANSMDSIRVDLSKAKAGPTYYRIEKENLHLPIGVKVLSISPSTINPILETVERRSVPVEIIKKNELPNGYRLVKMQANPQNVRIKGPRGLIEKTNSIKSDPIDLADVPASLKWDIPLQTGKQNIQFDEETDPKVVVEVEPTGSNFRVAGVPIRVANAKNVTIKPEKVSLYVNCPPNMIRALTPDKVKAYIDFNEKKSGIYVREVKVDLPAGVKLVKVVPGRAQVQVD